MVLSIMFRPAKIAGIVYNQDPGNGTPGPQAQDPGAKTSTSTTQDKEPGTPGMIPST